MYNTAAFAFKNTEALLDVVGGDTTSLVAGRLRPLSPASGRGGAENLTTQPVTTTHRGLSTDERERRCITNSMIRSLVGPEGTADLRADLHQALDMVTS
ncbi:PLP-dependent transferase [Homoserinimonas sp. OAct 916]|uniref:PLP-dependent transferase n=1 Tax=Homoserinimonas sp. OAct 916 TaxID=2211450 RepID=UPI0018E53570|nr:PLP-dependent transferase [Homoserinimonas sp. OAct 916]